MTPESESRIGEWLRYFSDLGFSKTYRDRMSGLPQRVACEVAEPEQAVSEPHTTFGQTFSVLHPQSGKSPAGQSSPVSPLRVIQPASLFDAADRIPDDSMDKIRETIGDCKRCRLHEKRTNIVFGVGNPKAELVFIGEGPGRDEDIQGEPFVGRAGKLLTQMIEAMGLRRESVYICNVVKCRPPDNRTPERDEMTTCSAFLLRQLGVIQPKAIVCLGSVAAQALLGPNTAVSKARGQWFDYAGSRLMPTYHPAYLLRNPAAKPTVWADLQLVMAFLGLPLPRNSKAPARV